jgi:hypothetical protein
MAIRDGPFRFLFDHTGDLYYGRGFEMLAVLEANFCPNTFSHASATLLSLITNKQDEECIHEFRARFEGHLHNISWFMPHSSSHALLAGTSSLLQQPPTNAWFLHFVHSREQQIFWSSAQNTPYVFPPSFLQLI